MWQAVGVAMVAGAAAFSAVTAEATRARGMLHGPSPFFTFFFTYFFSNIYMHVIMYFKYFNENKPQVLFDTV